MDQVIQWCNSNSGFLNAVLTATYVLATLVIVAVSVHGNRLQRQALEQTLVLENERLRPNVIFDLEFRDGNVFAVLRNIGLTAAVDVKIHLTPDLKRTIRGQESKCVLTDKVITFLAPSREITDFLASGAEFFQKYPTPVFKVEVSYNGGIDKSFNEPTQIDLSAFIGRLSIRTQTIHDLTEEVRSIRQEIRGIRDEISKKG
jgi:hypothetical protein